MKKLLVLMMIVVLSACSGEKDTVVKSGLNEEYVEDKQDYKYKASDLKTDKVCSEPLKLDKLRRFTFYMKLTYEQKLKAYQDWKSNLKSSVTIAKEL
ncbi:MAG: hypothetical protein SO237_04930, partial [Erysipelotrichaceae bacterium]|nr:hypothetical protein [Erysipelotrichaceae bacterium]